jgi:flagellar FliJ protein
MFNKKDFRLNPIINYKSNKINILEAEFARYKAAHQTEIESLIQLEQAKSQGINRLQHQQEKGALNCYTIELHQQYLKTIDDRLAQQVARVEETRSQLIEQRHKLVEALKEKKTLERLREIHEEKATQHLLRHEIKVIDDLVATSYHRRK